MRSVLAYAPGSHTLADPAHLCRRCGVGLGGRDRGTKARQRKSTGLCRDCYFTDRYQEKFTKCGGCGRFTPEGVARCIHCDQEMKERP